MSDSLHVYVPTVNESTSVWSAYDPWNEALADEFVRGRPAGRPVLDSRVASLLASPLKSA